MRRERRVKQKSLKFLYVAGLCLILLSILLVVLYKIYNNKLSEISESMLDTETIIGLVPNNLEDTNNQTTSASTSLSKTIDEVNENKIAEETNKETDEEKSNMPSAQEIVEEEKIEPKKELCFSYPVEGEVSKKFAMEELIYSETLEEWTTHQGMDIKADRTTVVKAAEEGTIVAIKNDPRYGLTVIIEHQDGYKTVYSNLLTTEFVSEDEKVEKGQSIGTVGNSAVFEIADEPHLHFEIIKDGEYVDPSTILK